MDESMDMTLAKFPTASPITHRPRDSVAQFFGDADFTQQLLILGELSPLKSPSRSPKVQSPIKQAQSPTPLQKFKALPLNSPTGPRSTVDSFFASPRPAVSSNLRYSVSASDIAESPEQQVSQPPRRDSVATFFGNKQMYANSPVKFNTPVRASRRDSVANFFRSSQTTASPEAMSSQAMETSMDAFASSQSVDMSLETESIDHSDDANVSMDMITGTASANMSDAMDMTHVQFSQSTCVLSGSDMDSMPRSSSWSTQESMSRSGSFEQQSSQEDTISKFFNHEGERPEQPEVDAVSDYAFDMGTPKATLDTAFSAAGKGSARGKRLSMVTPKAASKRNTPVKQSAGKTMPMRTPTASSKPPSRTPTKIPSARKATPKNAIDKQESFERTPTAAQPQSPMTRSRTRNLSSPALPSQASAKSTKSRNSRKSIGGRGLFETPPQMLNEHVAEAAEQSDYDDDALDNVSPIRDFRDSVQDLAQEEYDAPEESVLVEGELLNENEFNQPQDDESQQEDLNENADSPDHLDDNSEKNNIDLMDEHLSVVDDSFCQENFGVFEEQVEIEDLDQFLSVTGLLIADVSIPEFPEPVTLDYPASELDYLKAAVTTWPEYSLFEWGCKELIKYIETGKEEIELSKQEIQMEAPLVFVEYSQGTAQEREELVHSMKQLEDACFQQAKSQFLDWKTHFVEAHETPLYANLESLQSDEQVIDEELKRVSGTLEEIRQTHGDLDGDQHQESSNQLAELDDLNKNANTQVQHLEQLLRDLEAKNINLANDIIALETAEKTKKQSILDAEMKCRDLVVFDPEDLERFRQEYSILVLTHLWRPIELCAAKQVWLFDGIIQGTLVLQGSNYLVKLAVNHDHVDTNLVQISKSSAHIVKCLGIERIEGALRWHEKEWTSVEPTQLKKVPSLTQVFDSIAFLWESMKALYRDVQDAQSVCPIAMVGTSFRLDATFFSLAKRTRFTVTFEFDVKRGWLLYPSGQWSWSMVLDYGEFNHDMDELFHVATGSGMIAKWCRLIQEKLARE